MKVMVFGLLMFGIFGIAHADVNTIELGASFYTNSEDFEIKGTQDESDNVHVAINAPNGNHAGLYTSLMPDEGVFSVIQPVRDIFTNIGTYTITAFTDEQKKEGGIVMEVMYDGNRVTQIEDFVLELRAIPNVTVEEEETASFTARATDSAISDIEYSLDNNPPRDARIDSATGEFSWTPSDSDGTAQGAQYTFSVVAAKGLQTDSQSVTIIVKSPMVVEPEPEELAVPASFVEDGVDPQSYVDRYNTDEAYMEWFDENFSEYDSIYHAVGLEEPTSNSLLDVPASFVDASKDPQSYVDRYNTDGAYMEWFDENFSEYDSIYHAVGLEEPTSNSLLDVPASFVDASKDPQSYVDRYETDEAYMEWFDENFSEYDSIYHAVGLEEPVMAEEEYGECGPGTTLIEDTCTIIVESGGCLVATAAYGTELAPQVQLLREIRDNTVMSTASGAAFMSGFNQVYYTFSPTIADWERENPVFQEMVRAFITPMISTLSIMTLAESGSEAEVFGLGLAVIGLNLGMYVGVPAFAAFYGKRYIKSRV